jgi:hypothetical protein
MFGAMIALMWVCLSLQNRRRKFQKIYDGVSVCNNEVLQIFHVITSIAFGEQTYSPNIKPNNPHLKSQVAVSKNLRKMESMRSFSWVKPLLRLLCLANEVKIRLWQGEVAYLHRTPSPPKQRPRRDCPALIPNFNISRDSVTGGHTTKRMISRAIYLP